MSRDKGNLQRDWQKDMDMCNAFGDSVMPHSLTEFSRMLPYWLQEVKTLKEDNARWTCQWNGAEQKYLTQSNVIAGLRGRADQAEGELEVAYNELDKLRKEYTALDEGAASDFVKLKATEEREQKLKEAINEALKWTWYHGEANMKEIEEGLQEALSTLYPLDREDNK